MIKRIISMYVEGFRSMTIGRKLWALIIIKLLILFGVMKLFFFPNLLSRDYDTDKERASAVRSSLSKPRPKIVKETISLNILIP